MSKEKITIPYVRIVEKRDKAVLIDFGEDNPAWLPLYCTTLNETDYTVTAPRNILLQKLEEKKGAIVKKSPRSQERVTLPKAVWENNKSIGIDIIVSNLSGGNKVKKRLFFPKSQIQDGTAPRWMVEKKQSEAIKEVAKQKNRHENDLKVTIFKNKGLLNI